jgi:hypothetical protein
MRDRNIFRVGRGGIRGDRITDVLADLLHHDPDAREALCRLINAPALTHAEIRSQRWFGGERTDIRNE